MRSDPSQILQQEQRQLMRLSHQQLRYVRLLELNAPELDEAVVRELEENPALGAEEDAQAPDERAAAERDGGEPYWFPLRRPRGEMQPEIPSADDRLSLYDELNRQLDVLVLPAEVAAMARFIVGNLDSNGYLRRPLAMLVDDIAFSQGIEVGEATAQAALEAVRSLEPRGIGASDLRDCLELQLEAMAPSAVRDDALEIVRRHFEAFTMKHNHRIVSGMKADAGRVAEAVALIRRLNPKPGSGLGSGAGSTAAPVVPDFIVDRDENGQLTVALNNHIPELRIEESFSEAMRSMEEQGRRREARKGKEFVVQNYNDARDFIRILRQRQQTLFSVMTAIVSIQREYFETDDVHRLRPMMMKDIAALTGHDLSVISRATAGKYVATPSGIYPLRFFFSDGFGEEGEEFTNREVEAVIRRIVESEDKRHPMSDEKIRERMEREGYSVSRRTVAKYRDRLRIPVARLRRE